MVPKGNTIPIFHTHLLTKLLTSLNPTWTCRQTTDFGSLVKNIMSDLIYLLYENVYGVPQGFDPVPLLILYIIEMTLNRCHTCVYVFIMCNLAIFSVS